MQILLKHIKIYVQLDLFIAFMRCMLAIKQIDRTEMVSKCGMFPFYLFFLIILVISVALFFYLVIVNSYYCCFIEFILFLCGLVPIGHRSIFKENLATYMYLNRFIFLHPKQMLFIFIFQNTRHLNKH